MSAAAKPSLVLNHAASNNSMPDFPKEPDPTAVSESADSADSVASSKRPTWKTKEEIALHFQFGVRTITKLMRKRIIPYFKIANLVRFDLLDCDQAFSGFTRLTAVEKRNGIRPKLPAAPVTWKTKKQIAEHFGLGLRTVSKWMRRHILPYAKTGNLVRFDLERCEQTMQRFKHESKAAELETVATTRGSDQ